MNIKLSIVIPVYNVEKYVGQTLSSIASQKCHLEGVEVIVVDDGSPDNSMSIVNKYKQEFPHIKVIRQENLGLSVARNSGFAHVQGQYVWFVDSDDYLLPNSFDDIFNVIEKYPDADVLSSFLEVHDESGRLGTYYEKWANKLSDKYYFTGKEYLKRGFPQGAIQRFIFKRIFFFFYHLEFYPKILHEDDLFGFEMLYLASSIVVLSRPIYVYRINRGGSIMQNRSMKTPKSLMLIHRKLKEFMYERVEESDKDIFQWRIHNEIKNFFAFCPSLFNDKEYLDYYKEQRDYIRQESLFLLKKTSTFFYGLRIMYFPISYIKGERQLKSLYHKLRRK